MFIVHKVGRPGGLVVTSNTTSVLEVDSHRGEI